MVEKNSAFRYVVVNVRSRITQPVERLVTAWTVRGSNGQPQTCFGCGDTDHMHHVCSKYRGAKLSTATPTGSIWAHIAAPNPSSSGNFGTSANNDMGTHIGHQQPQQIPSAPMSSCPGEHESAPSPGAVEVCNTRPHEKQGTPETGRHITTPLMWAENTPDDEKTKRAAERPLAEAVKIYEE